MTQQTQFKKLKEQIEAAKRGLTEMSDTEIADGSVIEKNPEFTHPLSSKTSTEYKPGDRL